MLVGKLLFRRGSTRLCLLKQTRYSSQVALEPETTDRTSSSLRLAANREKRPGREPFAKNLCLGKFDAEFLTFPEPQTGERHRDFFEWLKPIEDYIKEKVDPREIDLSSRVKDEIYRELANLGVFRAAIEEEYGGLGLNNSEYAKLVETLSAVPILGSYAIQRARIVKLIHKYGTKEQKTNLLPKIANGEITPALCFSEVPSGSTGEPLESRVMVSDCRTFYTLNARKTCVFDATRANLFLVLAQNVNPDPYATRESTCAYLVPRGVKGITIREPYRALGQRGVDVCDVNFDNVEIPVKNLLGERVSELELFVASVGEGKHNVGAQAIGLTKLFLNLLITSVRGSKNFNSKRHLEDSTHEVVGKIAATLYAMEAMVYVTAGMTDNFENQDATLEQALVESFCTNSCREMISLGMSALGASGYLTDQPFERIVRDSMVLNCYDRSSIDTKIFAAMLAVQHAGSTMSDFIRKIRNPFMYPIDIIRMNLLLLKKSRLRLDESLHPTLREAANSLEHTVFSLKRCVEVSLGRSGLLIVNQRMELRRLTDIMIEIYAMTAVLARASRAYCIGLKNADDEIKVSMIFMNETYERVEKIAREVLDGDMLNGDIMLKEIATSIYEQKQYFAAHPLERNF